MANKLLLISCHRKMVSYLIEQVLQMLMALQPQTSSDKHRLIEIDEVYKIMRKAELALYMLVSKGLILVYKRGIKHYYYEDGLLKLIESGCKQMQVISL
jgi:hypothetical protein